MVIDWTTAGGSMKPLKTVGLKLSTTTLLASLLATFTSPSYANNPKVYTRVNGNTDIAINYQPLNNDSFNLVDMVAVSSNNSRATPHCVVRFGDLFTTRRTTAPISGFLLRAIQSCPRYDGLDGDTFGCAGSCVPVRQPRSVCHLSLATFGDGFITHTQEVNHD
ncbi:MAG: hypothetical protein Q7S87_07075 [Agitococcus sp.]|nr:hypothetical protein [Agitococcus sp.]